MWFLFVYKISKLIYISVNLHSTFGFSLSGSDRIAHATERRVCVWDAHVSPHPIRLPSEPSTNHTALWQGEWHLKAPKYTHIIYKSMHIFNILLHQRQQLGKMSISFFQKTSNPPECENCSNLAPPCVQPQYSTCTLLSKYALFFFSTLSMLLCFSVSTKAAGTQTPQPSGHGATDTGWQQRLWGQVRGEGTDAWKLFRLMCLFKTRLPLQCNRKPWAVFWHQRHTGRRRSFSLGWPGGDGPARGDLRHPERSELQRAGLTVRDTQPRPLQLRQHRLHLTCKAWIRSLLSHTSKRCWTGHLSMTQPTTNMPHSLKTKMLCIMCSNSGIFFPHVIFYTK